MSNVWFFCIVTMAYYSSYERSSLGVPYYAGHRSYSSSIYSPSPYVVRSSAYSGSYLPVSRVFFVTDGGYTLYAVSLNLTFKVSKSHTHISQASFSHYVRILE